MTVGRNIAALRKRRGLTLEELSELSGVDRSDLGQYERGAMTPRPETVERIARALDAPIAAIREGMGWTAPEPAEDWEKSGDDSLLRAGIVENLRESYGPDFALEEGDVAALMESVKASIPALIAHMRDTRPEAVISREILRELEILPPDGEEDAQYALPDGDWEQLCPLLPPENGGKGRAFKSNRLMLEGILWWMKSGRPWRELPERYGRWKCVSNRLKLWRETGTWGPVLQKMLELHVLEEDDVPAGLR